MKKPSRERVDRLLVDRGLVESRARAQALIMAGKVKVDGVRVDKAGTGVSVECVLEVDEGTRWASRGAYKLLKALEVFPVSPEGCVCLDIGASTGGFTDVLLNAGAEKVYAADVGYGQLHRRLAVDPRVVVMDRTNARTLTAVCFDEEIEFVVCDASFISLRLLLPAIDAVLTENGAAVVLIKPQFEAGRERLGKGGVVRDLETHRAVLTEILNFAGRNTRLRPAGLSWSPVRGPEGNIEFLCFLIKNTTPAADFPDLLDSVGRIVEEAHAELI